MVSQIVNLTNSGCLHEVVITSLKKRGENVLNLIILLFSLLLVKLTLYTFMASQIVSEILLWIPYT